jgi:hypothetical protein
MTASAGDDRSGGPVRAVVAHEVAGGQPAGAGVAGGEGEQVFEEAPARPVVIEMMGEDSKRLPGVAVGRRERGMRKLPE